MDPLQYLLSLEKFGIKFGLANIATLAAALGDPQTHFKSLLIAGTNGKGSVTAMTDRALRTSGLKVGRYTSPHLVRLEERFAVDGSTVDTDTLVELVEHVRQLIDDLLAKGSLESPPTFFEVTTAIAFEIFRRARVDIAVLEVGLGGRLDSTNIVQPIAAAITSIDFDHEQYLGNTLAAIAAEKAGVIRRGIPVVVGPLPTEARDVVVSMCELSGADFVEADAGVRIESTSEDGRTSMRITTPKRDYGWVPLGLRGEHQVPNAVVAVRLLEELERQLPVTPAAIASGIRDVRWPGRLQMIEVPGGRRVLLDAAHNPAGAFALARYLMREFPAPLPIVFGAVRDKDVSLMLKALLPAASMMVMTEPDTARAHTAGDLAAMARQFSPTVVIDVEPDPTRALDRAWTHCPVVCAAGSIFLVGNLLARIGADARDL
ncbi:MAG TPA: folylpolyglutamate synthase/dihydrofolate synthase family protein [Vicinamibacterales bacterium]